MRRRKDVKGVSTAVDTERWTFELETIRECQVREKK
jgi:hypothetical protein